MTTVDVVIFRIMFNYLLSLIIAALLTNTTYITHNCHAKTHSCDAYLGNAYK